MGKEYDRTSRSKETENERDDLPRFPLLVSSLEFVFCVKCTLLMSVREGEEKNR